MSSGFKRKRDDADEDDEPAYGLRQILPVANLPSNFEGEPEDGMQYLFTVRRETRQLPAVKRAPNPYETAPPEPALPSGSTFIASAIAPSPPSQKSHIPSSEWRSTFTRRFVNFRKNTSQPTIHVYMPMPRAWGQKIMPDKKERDRWWEFFAGSPASVWDPPRAAKQPKQREVRQLGNDDHAPLPFHRTNAYGSNTDEWVVGTVTEEQLAEMHDGTRVSDTDPRQGAFASGSLQASTGNMSGANGGVSELQSASPPSPPLVPREPTPTLLQYIDHRMSVHLLMYFTHWFNLHLEWLDSASTAPPAHIPTESHARWIFTLLGRVDAFCTADEISGLRGLARACLGLIRARRERRDGDVKGKSTEAHRGMGEVACWMVVCIVVGMWGQQDLWADAEEMLSKVGS